MKRRWVSNVSGAEKLYITPKTTWNLYSSLAIPIHWFKFHTSLERERRRICCKKHRKNLFWINWPSFRAVMAKCWGNSSLGNQVKLLGVTIDNALKFDDRITKNWIVFLVRLTDERCLALFPAGTIVRDPHHRECPTRREQGLNLRRTWVQAQLNEVVQ